MSKDLPAFPLDHLALQGKASAAALNIRGAILNYEELNCRVSRLAAILNVGGLAPGDRVATWLPKTEIACLMPLAAARAELVHVPVNPLLKPGQLEHILKDSGANLLVTAKSRIRLLDEIDTKANLVDEKDLLAQIDLQGAELPPLPDAFDTNTLCAILYTSGSTGRPKGVMLSHANLALGAVSVAQYLKLAEDDVTLAVLPLSFDYGQNQLFSTWQAGGCVAPLDYLMPRDVVTACSKYGVTTLAAVPPLWVQLVEQDWPEEASGAMRRLTNSGGALTPPLVRDLRKIFEKDTDIYAMYGLTEAFRSTYLDPALIDGNPTSMGRAIPYAEIIVVGKDGKRAAPGEEGELVHVGPLVAQGYWQDEKRTKDRFKPAPDFSEYGGMAVWSGDTVKRDADGLLYFVGRDDAMIKTSGNRVSPTEIEEAAVESGAVAEACALGQKDERLGEAIILFVSAEAGLEQVQAEEKLRGHLKTELPNFMQPAEIIWLDEFPKNANGKLDRSGLAARVEKL